MFRSFCCIALCMLLCVMMLNNVCARQAEPAFFGLFFPEWVDTEHDLLFPGPDRLPVWKEKRLGEAVGV